MKEIRAILPAGLILALCLTNGVVAADPAAKTHVAPAAEARSASKGSGEAAAVIPDSYKLTLLIQTTIIAVNQANKTSTYTVLRDLGSPNFRSANSAKQLAQIFKDLRETKFDLAPILLFTPKLLRAPEITDEGMLRLVGYFDTRPQIVRFDLLFESVKDDWLLFGIDIGTEPATAGQADASPK